MFRPPTRGAIPLTIACLALALMTAPADDTPSNVPGVASQPFGKAPNGEPVTLHTLTNKNGMSVSIMDYGATVVRIIVPDRNGKMADVVLGFDKLSPYFHQTAYFGAVVGRYGNRIARESSSSTTSSTSCRSTMGRTACTAGLWGSTSTCGKRNRSTPTARRCVSAC